MIALAVDRLDAYRDTGGEASAASILAQVARAVRATAATRRRRRRRLPQWRDRAGRPGTRARRCAASWARRCAPRSRSLAIANPESIAADHVTASVAVVTGRSDAGIDRAQLLTRAIARCAGVAAAGGNRVVAMTREWLRAVCGASASWSKALMGARVGAGCVLAIGLMAFWRRVRAALAGAWTLEAGRAGDRDRDRRAQASKVFDGNGNLQSHPALQQGRAAGPDRIWRDQLVHRDVGALAAARRHRGARRRAAQRPGLHRHRRHGSAAAADDSWVVSAQTTCAFPAPSTRPIRPRSATPIRRSKCAACSVTVSRPAAGRPSSTCRWRSVFAWAVRPTNFAPTSRSACGRCRDGCCSLQSFNVISEGAGALGFSSYSLPQAAAQRGLSLTPALSLQLGGFTTYSGRNALQENGLVLGGWYKF